MIIFLPDEWHHSSELCHRTKLWIFFEPRLTVSGIVVEADMFQSFWFVITYIDYTFGLYMTFSYNSL